MQTRTLLFRASVLLLTGSALSEARAVEPSEAATGASAGWELKGIHLGASLEDVNRALPNAACKAKPEDPGIVLCEDPKNTLGGDPALVVVKLLDGKVVQVSIENLTYEQAFAACVPLTAKFGPATRIDKALYKLQRGKYVVSGNKESCVWKDGENALYIDPADWTDKKKLYTYSAILLIDEAKHNREWVIRYNAKGSPADL